MILLWGMAGDGPLDAVQRCLEQRGVPLLRLDQADVLETAVELRAGAVLAGHIDYRGRRYPLEDFTAAYVRCDDLSRIPALAAQPPGGPARDHALRVNELLSCWLELTPARVVNRLSAMASNGSKPYQLGIIRAAGFAVPATLITNEPAAVEQFRREQGEVIYKSTSGVRSIVSRLAGAKLEQLERVRSCPTQFQRHVAGTDIRVHRFGDALFASEIVCAADDYRYAGRDGVALEIRSCELPPEVSERCLALACRLQLPAAGIDLRRGGDGLWYCFEVNPSPAYTFYQSATGQPMAEALAALLAGTCGGAA